MLPGLVSSRAAHIHFTVRVGGQEYVTAQLFFPESLTTELFQSHPDYKTFGEPDTTNSNDKVYTSATELLSTAKQSDGAILAWKTLVIRSSLATDLCAG